ncbi:hypothetical protein FA048_15515 [Pedobacter polaris]|uniref:DUF2975 domain-containing protein n=1 Tax=Pedobacter polaris TaxID=2571273 RepID=A0A4U1CMR8_9SPHI|nr:hypothetical protein [Pedobacter polaris]TKC06613.1 hypothetical protein FA048_15515 [Pedobacter polaris]
MRNAPSLKQIKRIPYLFLAFILSIVILIVCACIGSINQTEILNVNTKNLKAKTYRNIEIEENEFQTGTEGRLYWKVKNIKEAFLVIAADRDGTTNIYDLFYLLILDIALFVMMFKMKEDTVFSDQVGMGLKAIAFAVILYPGIILIAYRFSSVCIEELTAGKFTAQFRSLNIPKYLIIGYLIFFMIPFVKKGKSLQQEQELTI